jgi:steroid delta-isomerase-like uncharacterized protein
MSSAPSKAIIRQHFADVWNGGDESAAYRTLAPDIRIVDSNGRAIAHGPDGYLRTTAAFRQAFPGAHFSIAELIEEGDRVAVRLTLRGVHGATFQGIEPTGASVAIDGVIFYRLAAGQIVESWGLWDLLGLMQQRGAAISPH